jgi:hypothetical protein
MTPEDEIIYSAFESLGNRPALECRAHGDRFCPGTGPGFGFQKFNCLLRVVNRDTKDVHPLDHSSCAQYLRRFIGEFRITSWGGGQTFMSPAARLQIDRYCPAEAAKFCISEPKYPRRKSGISASDLKCLSYIAFRDTKQAHPLDGTKCEASLRAAAYEVSNLSLLRGIDVSPESSNQPKDFGPKGQQ